MSDTSNNPAFSSDFIKDIYLWRRKKLSLSVLAVSTATWVLLDLYQFNFVTVVSWLAMFISTLFFLYGNLVRLFRKEEPSLAGWEIPEQTAVDTANSIRESMERGVRWMFNVSAEKERFVFARVVAFLWLLSYLGSFSDFLTLVYIGVVVGMTVPLIYDKYEDKIKRVGEKVRMQLAKIYNIVDEKVIQKVMKKLHDVKGEEVKEKKTE